MDLRFLETVLSPPTHFIHEHLLGSQGWRIMNTRSFHFIHAPLYAKSSQRFPQISAPGAESCNSDRGPDLSLWYHVRSDAHKVTP